MSACGDEAVYKQRKLLITSALKYNPAKKIATLSPIEDLTSFRPFNVREIQFEVWDTSGAVND